MKKHYKSLEFDRIQDMLATFTTCADASEMAKELQPTDDLRRICCWQSSAGRPSAD